MLQPSEHLLKVHRSIDAMGERARCVRLDRNERVSPMERDVFDRVLAMLTPDLFCAYPDPSPLYAALSRALGVPESSLYLTNGSDAALRMIFQTFVRPGDDVVFADPSYAMYSIYTRVFRGRERPIAYNDDLTLDIGRVLALLEERPRVLVLANPDQPTGAVLAPDIVRTLAIAAQQAGTLFIVDEAYHPFYPETAVGLIAEFDNVIVTRTFSKHAGLAGLRLGYFCAHSQIVDYVRRVRGAHEVNAVAIAVGAYFVNHPELAAAHVADIAAGRAALARVADELGLGLPSCPANFQLLRFPDETHTDGIVAALKSRGYLVKGGFSTPGLRNCVRVTLGGPAVMARFASVLREIVGERPA